MHLRSHQYDFSLYLSTTASNLDWDFEKKRSIVVFFLQIVFVYASCNTLAMQISLLWSYILSGCYETDVSIVHLAMAEVVKMLLE